MAERTISISPINSTITLDSVQQEFAGFNIERMALLAENNCAYVQFSNAGEVETLANKYPDCHVTALAGAEIGFVEQGFKWPAPKDSAKAESLVVVKNCDRVGETSEARIRQVFKQFAIEKVAKFEETGEVVLQFHCQDDLELIDMYFDNFRVPELGPKAEIEVDNAFPIDRFIQRYLLRNQVRLVENKKQEQPPTQLIQPPNKNQEAISRYLKSKEQEKLNKEAQSKRKMEQMQREIMEKEKARRSQVEAFERARREKEEKERIERFARQKREREEREKREQIELEQQKKLQAIRQAQLQQEQKKLAEREQLQRKETEERQKMLEQEQQRFLVERISSIKREVEEEERRIQEKQQQAAKINEVPSAELNKDQSEPELEQILNEQRQAKKKSIKLPEINKSIPKQNITKQVKDEGKPIPKNRTGTEFVKKDYRITSVHFITAIVVVWIYYILVR